VPHRKSQKHTRPDMEDGRPDESTLPSGQPEPPSGQFTQKKKSEKK